MLAYLANIFNCINRVNTKMQGREENILTSTDKLLAFQKKIVMWKKGELPKIISKCFH